MKGFVLTYLLPTFKQLTVCVCSITDIQARACNIVAFKELYALVN